MFRRKSDLQKLKLLLRRVIDQSTPQDATQSMTGERRYYTRYGRNLPVLVVPVEDELPLMDKAGYLVSHDLSDGGIRLISQPITYSKLVIGLLFANEQKPAYENDPVYALAEARNRQSIGGGFDQTAFEFLSQFRHPDYLDDLDILAKHLIPNYLATPINNDILPAAMDTSHA